ncbi:hypothetical protein AB1Y20_019426 [Prymnesium parvum]|uniref:Tetraspanin n=2 Tax=Prymnesium parvum TaxID=97485 RepID=A0AB34JR60_PRYPA
MTMYNNYWLPFSGRIYAALSIKKQLVAETDRDRTNEDYDGNTYNMDRGSRTLVLAREREFHAELDRRGLRWQQDKRNELFVSTRDNRDLIAALRTIRGKRMHLFNKDAIVEDGAYHGGARRSRITIVDTQPRRTQPRDAAIPSITVRLSSDWLDQLRAGNPSMYARLVNIVQRHRPPVETMVRMQPEDVAEMRAGTPRGNQIARLPELGRASHWETRTMRDDVMTYGGGPAVISSITLAAMEDLGHYLANYSNAGCMYWGYKQGCSFVTSRCGAGQVDYSVTVSSPSECTGLSWWGQVRDGYLESKCVGGTTPCAAEGGYLAASDGTRQCTAQCASDAPRDDCSAAPSGAIASSSTEEELRDKLAELLGLDASDWKLYAIVGAAFLLLIAAVAILNSVLCPDSRRAQQRILVMANTLIAWLSLAGLGLLVYMVAAPAGWPFSYHAFEAFVERGWLLVGVGVAAFLLLLAFATIWGAVMRNTRLLLGVWCVYVLMLLLQAALTGVLVYWIIALKDVSRDSVDVALGSQRYENRFGGEVLAAVEGYLCGTYRACCMPEWLRQANASASAPTYDSGSGTYANAASQRTCLQAHEGVATELDVQVQDPSNPSFCKYVTGATHEFAPDAKVCPILDEIVDQFSRSECEATFCPLGVDGYQIFVRDMVEFTQDNAIKLAIGFGVLLALELMMMTNAWRLRRSILRSKEALVFVGANDLFTRGDPKGKYGVSST